MERLRAADGLAVDVGTGDGAYVLRSARALPRTLHIGLDASADGLRQAAAKAARKPARGGAANALFVRSPIERLPDELAGLANAVTVLLPWGTLLRAVAAPDPSALAALRSMCAPGARLAVVLGYDAAADPAAAVPPLSRARLEDEVLPRYRDAGFGAAATSLGRDELRALGTTWASRLAFGRERPFFRIDARLW